MLATFGDKDMHYWFFLSLFLVTNALGQVESRVVPFPVWSCDEEWEDPHLELVDIRVAGQEVELGKPFKADSDWLKQMVLRVKNTGSNSILTIGMGGGLLGGIDEELPPGASFQYGVNWNWGKATKARKRRSNEPVILPGEMVELSYRHIDSLTRKALAKPGEGSFRNLKIMAPSILYADGTTGFDIQIKFPGGQCSE